MILLLVAVVAGACRREEPLPVLYPIPPKQLVDDSGRAFGLGELRGHPSVYAFVFTRCAGPCPLMAVSMKRVATSLPRAEGLRFVLVSVDPEHDTPEVLREYRKKVGADDRWVLLTGTEPEVTSLSVNDFKLALSRSSGVPQHSTKFALADGEGMIRAYYDALSREDVDRLIRDLVRLSKD